MAFAVLQTDVNPPDRELLMRAFCDVDFLAKSDAGIIARDSYGILIGNLDYEKACLVEDAIRRQGYDQLVVVHEDEIPTLPPPVKVRRVDALDEHLAVYVGLGEPERYSWDRLALVASGEIARNKPATGLNVTFAPQDYAVLSEYARMQTPVTLKKSPAQPDSVMIHLVLTDATVRPVITPGTCSYEYLGDRKKGHRDNFIMLLADLMRLAPKAIANAGAMSLAQNPSRPLVYSRLGAMENEMRWLLWDSARAKEKP